MEQLKQIRSQFETRPGEACLKLKHEFAPPGALVRFCVRLLLLSKDVLLRALIDRLEFLRIGKRLLKSLTLKAVIYTYIILSILFQVERKKMPKEGLTAWEWKKRLEDFASGKFIFGRGQYPPKGSKRATQLEQIKTCPRHKSSNLLDPFGRRILCQCSYHKAVVSVNYLVDLVDLVYLV